MPRTLEGRAQWAILRLLELYYSPAKCTGLTKYQIVEMLSPDFSKKVLEAAYQELVSVGLIYEEICPIFTTNSTAVNFTAGSTSYRFIPASSVASSNKAVFYLTGIGGVA